MHGLRRARADSESGPFYYKKIYVLKLIITMKYKPRVIYKNENFLAISKPAGLLIHQTVFSKSKEPTLADWLMKNFPEVKSVGDNPKERPGIVHRLDKDTSGVIIIARNQKYFEYLKNLFQKHQIKKTYIALVYGKLKKEKGIIETAISLKPGTTKRTIHKGKMTKEAITEYEVLKTFERVNEKGNTKYFSFMKVSPKTGRTHQIRVHLASIGHPIVGDTMYGPKENPFGLSRQFLHAEAIEFNIDEKNKIKIEAELPRDLQSVLKSLETLTR